MRLENLVLYYKPTCPYCKKVLKAIKELNLDIAMQNISKNPEAKETLTNEGGKATVPCLRITESEDVRWQYESDDIIELLKANFS